jgi:hypothetical protein
VSPLCELLGGGAGRCARRRRNVVRWVALEVEQERSHGRALRLRERAALLLAQARRSPALDAQRELG